MRLAGGLITGEKLIGTALFFQSKYKMVFVCPVVIKSSMVPVLEGGVSLLR